MRSVYCKKLQSIPSIKPCERVSMFRRLGFVSFSFGFRFVFVWVSFCLGFVSFSFHDKLVWIILRHIFSYDFVFDYR